MTRALHFVVLWTPAPTAHAAPGLAGALCTRIALAGARIAASGPEPTRTAG